MFNGVSGLSLERIASTRRVRPRLDSYECCVFFGGGGGYHWLGLLYAEWPSSEVEGQ
jgi:hypothetical protein